jgi:Ca-activated chloride channel family protein
MRFLYVFIILVLCSAPAFADLGAGDVRLGNALYRKGEFQHAIQRYERAAEKNPSDARIAYNLGAAAYQSKDYDAAIGHFQKSLLTDDDKFRRDVHFNLGDAFYRSGIGREDKDIDQSIKKLESSLASFEKAMALDPKDKQSVENYAFVKEVLEKFKQKQQKQDQQKQDQQSQDQQRQEQDQQKQDQSQDQQKPEEQKSQDQKDQEKQDQEQQDQQQQDQEKQDQQNKQDEKSDKEQQDQNNGASGQMPEGQISSQKDANNMVDDFERNEMPKGLLNFIQHSQEARPVDKDW